MMIVSGRDFLNKNPKKSIFTRNSFLWKNSFSTKEENPKIQLKSKKYFHKKW
jgi:hypothetical protein